jgi:two-component system, OmpR family, response regulator
MTLYREMRSALGDRCPRVLFVSATPPEELHAGTAALPSAVGYLKKPFHLDDLSRIVKEALAA